jgi:lysine-N-methylase
MMWLTRVFHSSGVEKDKAIETAIKIVDDNFGFNPLLGAFKQRVILNSIRVKNELFKLVAWYGK